MPANTPLLLTRFARSRAPGRSADKDDPVDLSFEWDEAKALSNESKHGISFDEAVSAFGDPHSLTVGDPDRSEGEHRFVLVGASLRDRLLVVVHAERGDNVRIVSARRARRREVEVYEQQG